MNTVNRIVNSSYKGNSLIISLIVCFAMILIPAIQTFGQVKVKERLQFLHFEGNFDYYYVVFLNKDRDTVQLVTDQVFDNVASFNRMYEVHWAPDTLFEAGEGDKPYVAKRMYEWKTINGGTYSRPITEKQVLDAVKSLPEVRENADRVVISERPDAEKRYYQVETTTVTEDRVSRLFTFHVYVYPKFEVKAWDVFKCETYDLDTWRKMRRNGG